MRVLHIAAYRWPTDMEKNGLDLAVLRGLSRRLGDQAVIVQSEDGHGGIWTEPGITVHFIAPSRGPRWWAYTTFAVRAYYLARSITHRQRVDVVNGSDLVGAVVGTVLSRSLGVPLFVQLQNELLAMPSRTGSSFKRALMRVLARYACKHAAIVRCLSRGILEQASRAGIKLEKLRLLGSRVDTQLFDPALWREQAERRRHSLGLDGRAVLIYVGSLVPRKGVDDLLEAFIQATKVRGDLHLLFLGAGTMEAVLRDRAHAAGLTSVTFLGRVPHESVPLYLAVADVFVFPSISEGMPRAVLEALSMGLPVVATRIPGIVDIVSHGVNGILFEPGNRQELTRVILELAADHALRVRLGEAGRRLVQERYSFDRNLDEFAAILREAAGNTTAQ